MMNRWLVMLSLMLESTQVCIPAEGDAVTLTDKNDAGATQWGAGAWAELSANVGEYDYFPRAVQVSAISAATEFQIDIGVGAAGSEEVIGSVNGSALAALDPKELIMITERIPPESRLVARLRTVDSDGKTVNVKITAGRVTSSTSVITP